MPQKRIWSMERAMIAGKPVQVRTTHATEWYHLRCKGLGKNRIVVEFVTKPIAQFLVAAANEMEKAKINNP